MVSTSQGKSNLSPEFGLSWSSGALSMALITKLIRVGQAPIIVVAIESIWVTR